MDSSSDEIKAPKKARRQRAVRKSAQTSEDATTRKRVARKRTGDKAPKQEKVVTPEKTERTPAPAATQRKAPTPIKAKATASKRKMKRRLIVAALLLTGIGASAAVGVTDQGHIDVAQTIEDRNQRIRNNAADANDVLGSDIEVPVQNTQNKKPDGGLKGRGIVETPTPTPPPGATSTATSSPETASSTDTGVATSSPAIPDGITDTATTTVDAVDSSAFTEETEQTEELYTEEDSE